VDEVREEDVAPDVAGCCRHGMHQIRISAFHHPSLLTFALRHFFTACPSRIFTAYLPAIRLAAAAALATPCYRIYLPAYLLAHRRAATRAGTAVVNADRFSVTATLQLPLFMQLRGSSLLFGSLADMN